MRSFAWSVAVCIAVAGSAALAQGDDPEICRSGLDLEAGIEACDRIINSERYSPETTAKAYVDRGQKYYQSKDYARAIEDASAAIRMGSLLRVDLAIAYSNRGNAYFVKNDTDRAIENYSEAIRLNPDFAAPYTARGLMRERKGETAAALADFRAALRVPRGNFDDDDWAKSTSQRRIDELTKR